MHADLEQLVFQLTLHWEKNECGSVWFGVSVKTGRGGGGGGGGGGEAGGRGWGPNAL